MENISDSIERFILDAFSSDDMLHLCRNELANFFGCSPSQINYVLSTRFTIGRGYDIESKRGGNGYIKLIRISGAKDWVSQLLNNRLTEPIGYSEGKQIVASLVESEFLSVEESKILLASITDKALASPLDLASQIRTQIMRQVIIAKMGK